MDFHLNNALGCEPPLSATPTQECLIASTLLVRLIRQIVPGSAGDVDRGTRGRETRFNFQSRCERVISVIRKSLHRIIQGAAVLWIIIERVH